MSAASKGLERQTFIDSFLSEVFPTPFRFGTGDATDVHGARSGQLDVVIEYPFSPSLPSVGSANTRLYLAESIAAVVEVKSNLQGQWGDAVATAKALRPIRRSFGAQMRMGPVFDFIPLFAVGYTGWKQVATLQSHLQNCPEISGALVIDAGIFAASKDFGSVTATAPWSLWALISCLHLSMQSLKVASTSPLQYAM